MLYKSTSTRRRAPNITIAISDKKKLKTLVQRARKMKMQKWSDSTIKRRQHLRRVIALLQHNNVNIYDQPNVVVGVLAQLLLPSSLCTYLHTLQAMYPQLKQNEKWTQAVGWAEKLTAKNPPQQATPATLEQLRTIWRHATHASRPSRAAATAIISYITASRHADLHAQVLTHNWICPNFIILRFALRIWKSGGRKHQRFFTKTIQLPQNRVGQLLYKALRKPASYKEVYDFLQPFNITPHSMRVTAVTNLAATHSDRHIILLTGHTQPDEPRAIWRYTAPRPDSELSSVQRTLSRFLLNRVSH